MANWRVLLPQAAPRFEAIRVVANETTDRLSLASNALCEHREQVARNVLHLFTFGTAQPLSGHVATAAGGAQQPGEGYTRRVLRSVPPMGGGSRWLCAATACAINTDTGSTE